MNYNFKEVQIYIKLLPISSKAEANYIITYVLISTERVKVTVKKQIHHCPINLLVNTPVDLRTVEGYN